jgi:outer membrane lipoprotein carrier protein
LLLASPVAAQDVPAVLARADSAYRKLTALRAEFEQTIVNPMLGGPEVSRGTLYLVPPSKLAMRFRDPEGDRIVADGQWLWAYTPSTVPGQVIRQAMPQAGAASPNLFAQFVDRPLERYEATAAGSDSVAGDPVDLVRLVPKVEGLPFRRVTIAVSRETGLLRWLDIVEESGQRRSLVLVSMAPNAPVLPAEVRFDVPRGVRVVSQ